MKMAALLEFEGFVWCKVVLLKSNKVNQSNVLGSSDTD